MRKSITKILLATMALCAPLSAEVFGFEAGGIYYNITSDTYKTVEVTFGSSVYAGDITIPSSVSNSGTTYTVTSIGEGAFQYCSSLTSVAIPDGVTSIGERAFYKCSILTSINIPVGVMGIGRFAFSGCSSLTKVTLGSGLETIWGYTFSDCSSLTSINIPDKVATVGERVFYGCTSLVAIYCTPNEPPVCNSACFDYVDKSACTLYVPEGTADDYKAANVWKDFLNIVETDFAGTEEIAADAAADVKVYAAAGRIVVENAAAGTPIAVYTADGVLIYGGVVSDTRTEIPAPAGKLYIVKCGKAVFKTVM